MKQLEIDEELTDEMLRRREYQKARQLELGKLLALAYKTDELTEMLNKLKDLMSDIKGVDVSEIKHND